MMNCRDDVAETRRSSRRLTAWSGLLLFICLFIPAISAGDSPLRPIEAFGHPEFLPFLFPYLIGLVVGIRGIVEWRERRPSKPLAVVVMVFAVLISLGYATILTLIMLIADSTPAPLVPMAIGWAALAGPLVAIFNPRNRFAWRSARGLWLAGALCALWFGSLLFGAWMDGQPEWTLGLWLALAASIGTITAGVKLERTEYRRAISLPAARARG